jgi:hypothetical protein
VKWKCFFQINCSKLMIMSAMKIRDGIEKCKWDSWEEQETHHFSNNLNCFLFEFFKDE